MKSQHIGHEFSLILPPYDSVKKTVFKLKFRALEPLWKLFSSYLLNDALARKAYKSLGLCDYHIPEHCKAGGNSACGGVGQSYGVEQARIAVQLYRSRHLCHLHK